MCNSEDVKRLWEGGIDVLVLVDLYIFCWCVSIITYLVDCVYNPGWWCGIWDWLDEQPPRIIIESNRSPHREEVEKEIIKEGGGTHFNSASLVARQAATLLASLGRWKVEFSLHPIWRVQYGRWGVLLGLESLCCGGFLVSWVNRGIGCSGVGYRLVGWLMGDFGVISHLVN